MAAAQDDLDEHAMLVAGSCPVDDDGGAMHARAAQALGVAVGDVLTCSDPTVPSVST